MGKKSKQKGSTFEREVVNKAKEYGLASKRAYASNGQALGLHEEVDVLIGPLRGQCKRRKKFSREWETVLKPGDNVDVQIVRADNQPAYAILPFKDLLHMLSALGTPKTGGFKIPE